MSEPQPPARKPVFEHYCHCGAWGAFGYGVSLLQDRPGTWFCAEHRRDLTPGTPPCEALET